MSKFTGLRGDAGFTMIELIMVIIVIGFLASVAVPKYINMTGEAFNAKCDAHRGAIASAMALTYCVVILSNPTQTDWLESATMADVQDSMFVTGVTPTCPMGGTYTLSRGNVSCSLHGF